MNDAADNVNAFMAHGFAAPVASAEHGPLAGLTLAVKDMYDVEGLRTGFGNPVILEQSGPAHATNRAIRKLLDSGARFAGKTQCDELTFSLMGKNDHYPRPINSAASARLTGGSSSGSAAAVAAGLCDIAIGSDTGGSVRAPASFCGLFGLRPTHGAVALDHARGLAPSFDTFGWFTRDADTYRRVADLLLPEDTAGTLQPDLIEPEFAAHLLEPASRAHWDRFRSVLELSAEDVPGTADSDRNYLMFRRLQSYEAWALHGDFVSEPDNRVSPGIVTRFRYGEKIGCGDAAEDTKARQALRTAIGRYLDEGKMLVFPTTPGPVPYADDPDDAHLEFREQALRLLCISGLTGFPQMSVPAGTVDGAPFGLSVLGPAGSDHAVIDVVIRLHAAIKEYEED